MNIDKIKNDRKLTDHEREYLKNVANNKGRPAKFAYYFLRYTGIFLVTYLSLSLLYSHESVSAYIIIGILSSFLFLFGIANIIAKENKYIQILKAVSKKTEKAYDGILLRAYEVDKNDKFSTKDAMAIISVEGEQILAEAGAALLVMKYGSPVVLVKINKQELYIFSPD